MPIRLLYLALLLVPAFCLGQNNAGKYHQRIEYLQQQVAKAASDSEKVAALGKLAVHYYIFKATTKGDSVLQEQLALAEGAANRGAFLDCEPSVRALCREHRWYGLLKGARQKLLVAAMIEVYHKPMLPSVLFSQKRIHPMVK